jgi:ABC-type polysaccharide/polyol phosphate export permease
MFNKLAQISTFLLGFDVFCLNKKFLVANLVNRNLKIKYHRSFLGFFWTILAPLAMSAIYYFVFTKLMKFERPHYLASLLVGTLSWTFFSQTIIEATETITVNSQLLTKIPMPIHIFPYVISITNFSTLAFSAPVILIGAFVSNVQLTWNALWIFYFFFLLMLFCYAIGSIVAIFFVYLRDLKHAIGVMMQLWFYGTPILYDTQQIPEKFKFIIYANPVGAVFDGIHQCFIEGHTPSLATLGASFIWLIAIFALLRLVYTWLRPGLIERI